MQLLITICLILVSVVSIYLYFANALVNKSEDKSFIGFEDLLKEIYEKIQQLSEIFDSLADFSKSSISKRSQQEKITTIQNSYSNTEQELIQQIGALMARYNQVRDFSMEEIDRLRKKHEQVQKYGKWLLFKIVTAAILIILLFLIFIYQNRFYIYEQILDLF